MKIHIISLFSWHCYSAVKKKNSTVSTAITIDIIIKILTIKQIKSKT